VFAFHFSRFTFHPEKNHKSMTNNINSKELKQFIKQHSPLWWWVPEDQKENLSLNSVVEALLNYGSVQDIKELFGIVGIKKVAEIFDEAIRDRQRSNYSPAIQNFFKLYFERHA
jgi:hypothetical protein